MTPTRREKPMIPVAKPALGDPEARAVRRVILSGWVTQGPEVAAFEQDFARFVGAPHACAVSNCTTALHLALLVAGVAPGDEVITVSHSFIATANVIRYCGARPVFVDVRPDTFNMDPARVEEAITPRTRAILCVHQIGMPCNLPLLAEIARRHSLVLIEDAACAIGSEIRRKGQWERIGKPHGDIACFSFHPRKLVTTGDGGMITTANADWDRRFRLLRQHGMSVPDTVRHGAREVIFESYPEIGFNFRMTDVQAAIGREQLKRLPLLLDHRRQLARRYARMLSRLPVRPPEEPDWARSNWQSYAVQLGEGVDQRATMQRLLDAGISTRRGVMCAHREPAYAGQDTWTSAGPLTVSEQIQDRTIILPLHADLTEEDQQRIVDALEAAHEVVGV